MKLFINYKIIIFLQQQIVEITHKNNDLLQERDILMNKLKSFSEDESKK